MHQLICALVGHRTEPELNWVELGVAWCNRCRHWYELS